MAGVQWHKLLTPDSSYMEAVATKLVLILTVSLQFIILIILIRRHLLRRFFWFSVYIGYELVQDSVRLAVAGNQGLYFKVYWVTAACSLVFTVLAVRESFLNVFRPHTRLRLFTGTVWGCVGIALLYALLKAWLFPPVSRGWQTAAIIGLELAEQYSLCAVGILYFACMKLFKMRGHQWESGVMLGFTTYMALALWGFLTRSIFGTRFRLVSVWLPPVAFIIGEITWLLELSRLEPQVTEVPALSVDDLGILEHYIKALARLFGGKS